MRDSFSEIWDEFGGDIMTPEEEDLFTVSSHFRISITLIAPSLHGRSLTIEQSRYLNKFIPYTRHKCHKLIVSCEIQMADGTETFINFKSDNPQIPPVDWNNVSEINLNFNCIDEDVIWDVICITVPRELIASVRVYYNGSCELTFSGSDICMPKRGSYYNLKPDIPLNSWPKIIQAQRLISHLHAISRYWNSLCHDVRSTEAQKLLISLCRSVAQQFSFAPHFIEFTSPSYKSLPYDFKIAAYDYWTSETNATLSDLKQIIKNSDFVAFTCEDAYGRYECLIYDCLFEYHSSSNLVYAYRQIQKSL